MTRLLGGGKMANVDINYPISNNAHILRYFDTSLATLFITLKLLDKIDWSWVWVLAPIWIACIVYEIWNILDRF